MHRLLREALRAGVVAAVAVVGAFLAIGCAVAILFELQGFGRPRDTDPRLWYVALLGLALVACVVVPVALAGRRRR